MCLCLLSGLACLWALRPSSRPTFRPPCCPHRTPALSARPRSYQKLSLYSWALGSVCTVAAESYAIAAASVVRKEGESDEEYGKRVEEVKKAINARLFTLVHGLVQVGGWGVGGA